MFTNDGLSGPVVLANSGLIARALTNSEVAVELDLLPEYSYEQIENKILQFVKEKNNKALKNIVALLIPARLADFLLVSLKIDTDIKMAELTKLHRDMIIKTLKKWIIAIKAVGPFERAMLTTGGVDIREINQKNYQSKLIDNLYIIGELLDIDGPTGGFNLQICWTSGYTAGEAVLD